jgi:hypothetical protein
LFRMFHLFQTHVASVLFGCCISCNDYIANVCFICFRRMLSVLSECYKSRSRYMVVD